MVNIRQIVLHHDKIWLIHPPYNHPTKGLMPLIWQNGMLIALRVNTRTLKS